jgi:hypothetical protein
MSIISFFKPRKYKTIEDLLLNTVTTTSGCMEWKGTRDKYGYGRMWHEGRAGYKAHRLSMKLSGYSIDGWVVCHKCDNPSCINPDHLFLGTYADNIRDAQSKGRFPIAKPKPQRRPMNRPAIHGTKAKYSNGCKCRACMDANRNYVRNYRLRNKKGN